MAPQVIRDEADIGVDDCLDSYRDDASSLHSDTTTLSSSVQDYQYENGRRYHAYNSGKYALPNDETEQNRLDMMHHVWLLILRGDLIKAPIDRCTTKKALDLGCGNGSFTIDFADGHPDWEITGTDLSPIQPTWVPENVKFVVDDFEEPWTWPKESFGYIHTRNLVGAVQNWSQLLENIYEHLTPGGYVELQESDVGHYWCDDKSVPEKGGWYTYAKTLNQGANAIGRRVDITPELADIVQKAGFVDVHVEYKKCPVGAWAKDRHKKELGRWAGETMQTGAEAYGLALFTRAAGKSHAEAKKIINDLLDEVNNPDIHVYIRQYVIYGRKK